MCKRRPIWVWHSNILVIYRIVNPENLDKNLFYRNVGCSREGRKTNTTGMLTNFYIVLEINASLQKEDKITLWHFTRSNTSDLLLTIIFLKFFSWSLWKGEILVLRKQKTLWAYIVGTGWKDFMTTGSRHVTCHFPHISCE